MLTVIEAINQLKQLPAPKVATLSQLFDELEGWFRPRFPSPMSGRHRRVYCAPEDTVVLKVPKCSGGMNDNLVEFKLYSIYKKILDAGKHYEGDPHYAHCYVEDVWSVPLLVMDRVRYPKSYQDLPRWIDFVDCRQVGFNSDGKLVAYDYAP